MQCRYDSDYLHEKGHRLRRWPFFVQIPASYPLPLRGCPRGGLMKGLRPLKHPLVGLRPPKVPPRSGCRIAAEGGNPTNKYLKRQVRRNAIRFPEDFMFELTQEEFLLLRCHFGASKERGGNQFIRSAEDVFCNSLIVKWLRKHNPQACFFFEGSAEGRFVIC